MLSLNFPTITYLEDKKENIPDLMTNVRSTLSCHTSEGKTHDTRSRKFMDASINVKNSDNRVSGCGFVSNQRIGGSQFRIGSFAPFSGKRVSPNTLTWASTRLPTPVSPFSVSTTDRKQNHTPCHFVAPSDILDDRISTVADFSVDSVALDHDYCFKTSLTNKPQPIQSDPQPKLGRPPTRQLKKRQSSPQSIHRKSVHKVADAQTQFATNHQYSKLPKLNTKSKVTPLVSKPKPLVLENQEPQDTKVKITGNYKDDFVYYISKSDRCTQRQKTKLHTPYQIIPTPPPMAGDIIVPRLSDTDLQDLLVSRERPFFSNSSCQEIDAEANTKIHVMDDSVFETSINSSFNQSVSVPFNELTPDELNVLFNAIDEIQSRDLEQSGEISGSNSSYNSSCSESSSSASLMVPANVSSSADTDQPSQEQFCFSPVKQNIAEDTAGIPWIVIVTVYWNDLPAVMIARQPYIRLIDIHKQVLLSKDTGILKKRCQLLDMEIHNCTEMQRYFLIKYGHAHNSKSTLIVSKDSASRLIGFYVDAQQKGLKSPPKRKRNTRR